jgi:hypothetical protein
MKRPLLLVATLIAVISQLSMRSAAAQVGWVHLRTHPTTDNTGFDYGVTRTFEQSGSGMVETFSLAYAPGQHTLALVEAPFGVCRGTATNISFTIVANQWTEVDVPVTLQDCSFRIELVGWSFYEIGTGTVAVKSGNVTYASCTVARDPARSNRVFWPNYHDCQATIPYNTTFQTTATPDGISGTATVFGGTQTANASVTSPDVSFSSNFAKYMNDSSYSTDLEIHRVSSRYGGQVMSSVFEVVNRGPNLASEVNVNIDSLIAPFYGEEGYKADVALSTSDGICGHQTGYFGDGCHVLVLGVGDSIAITVRIEGTPDQYAATTSTPRCTTVSVTSARSSSDQDYNRSAETNLSNNKATCVDDAVPVVVALGGSTPSSHTVSVGSTNVPMIEFTLTPSSAQTVNSVTIAANGSGNEQVDVTAVKLYIDKNANGQVDAGDTAIASSTFAVNNGTVIMNVNPAYSISAPTNLLVTYDFNITVAQRLGGGLTFAMLPLLFLPAVWRRKRVAAMIVMAMIATVGITACGSDSSTGPPPGGSSVTFQSNLTSVDISGTDIASPLAGATITINK